jgi:hypothetical protein
MKKKRSNQDLLDAKVEAAFQQAAKKVIKRARETNTPVIIWENGSIKEVLSTQFGSEFVFGTEGKTTL